MLAVREQVDVVRASHRFKPNISIQNNEPNDLFILQFAQNAQTMCALKQ